VNQTLQSSTPFEMVGGTTAVQQIVDRFYDLMDEDESYGCLRGLHAPDLRPMRKSLAGFLTAWLGGPRDWFDEQPGRCMMSAHRGVPMSTEVGRQWAEAMTRAIADSPVEPAVGAKMAAALSELAARMAG
jgi:hemoglobin